MIRGSGPGRFGAASILRRVLGRFKPEPPVTPGVLEPEELRRLLGKPDPVILDIGCNDGTHTLMFLRLFARARVFAFEPDARARRRFEATVRDARARLFATAIGAVDGVAAFYPSDGAPSAEWAARLPEGWDFSGSIRKPKQHLDIHPWCRFGQKTEVALTRLDSWAKAQDIGEVDFIWADVQGAEEDLVEGGRETLNRTRYFYTEYSNRELYEGQANLAQLLGMLPDFELVHRYQGEIHRYQGDVLLRNRRFDR
ncbi:MAG: FkbM family methyltransferase [Burkholderiales bacterium]|jgi:FkbM family methyltransferase